MEEPTITTLRRRRASAASRLATVDRTDVHWIDEGRQMRLPPILMLSAQWLGAEHFAAFAAPLAHHTRVVRLDLPGHGLSGPFGPDGAHSAQGYARLVRAFLAHAGLAGCVVLGQSHSGIPAALLAADPAAGLRGLVLATSSGMPRDRAAAAKPVPTTQPEGAPGWYEERLRPLLHRADPALFAPGAHAYGELPGRAGEAAERLRLFDPALFARTLPQVAVPTRVLWSDGSTYLPAAMAEACAALLPGCRGCTVIPDTGHLLLADAPQEAADLTLAFLETLA
ncbi:alpha/beta hydrolase [Novosphingobium resinovorum]|uniref:alpha/beta fold hydrolase n=1 Tax=Novosphingobium resinovorum TaxID=158500 RepID=UPI002ED0C6CA|nr:alpha/beta hydrolase [Novosphingobium resinovorum]